MMHVEGSFVMSAAIMARLRPQRPPLWPRGPRAGPLPLRVRCQRSFGAQVTSSTLFHCGTSTATVSHAALTPAVALHQAARNTSGSAREARDCGSSNGATPGEDPHEVLSGPEGDEKPLSEGESVEDRIAQNLDLYVTMTEVSTCDGLRWLDVESCGVRHTCTDFAEEGYFDLAVIQALKKENLPRDVIEHVGKRVFMPVLHIKKESGFTCLLVRSAKFSHVHHSESGRRPNRHWRRTRLLAHRRGGGCGKVKQLIRALMKRVSFSGTRVHVSSAAATAGLAAAAPGRHTVGEPPKEHTAASASTIRAEVMRKEELRRKAEEEKSFYRNLAEAYAVKNASRVRSSRLLRGALHNSPLDSRRRASKESVVWPAGEELTVLEEEPWNVGEDLAEEISTIHPQTLDRITDRLTIVVYREVDDRFDCLDVANDDARHRPRGTIDGSEAEPRPPRAGAAGAKTVSDGSCGRGRKKRWRWRIITVHRNHMPFIGDMLFSWNDPGSVFRLKGNRLLFYILHGVVQTIQQSNTASVQKLGDLETVLFRSVTRENELACVLAQIHSISRLAHLNAKLLRELRHCITCMRSHVTLDMSVSEQFLEDQYIRSAISLSDDLDDQARSLLFLQFSVAMNTLERHLRTLTVFSTFFIPLDFISSFFGTNFCGILDLGEMPRGLYLCGVVMLATALVTTRWMRRTLRM